jgi:hypothetical protein
MAAFGSHGSQAIGGGSAASLAGTHKGQLGAKSSHVSQPGQPGQGSGAGAGPGGQPAGVSQGSSVELLVELGELLIELEVAPPPPEPPPLGPGSPRPVGPHMQPAPATAKQASARPRRAGGMLARTVTGGHRDRRASKA